MKPSKAPRDGKQEKLEDISGEELKAKADQIDRDRGQRVRRLRGMLGIDMNAFAKLAGISRVTLSFWENAKHAKLSYPGACKVINAVKSQGVDCTIEWLWDNAGEFPRFINQQSPQQQFINDEPSYLFSGPEKEINLFLSLNKNAAITKIDTGNLLPFYAFGDIVAGLWQPTNAMRNDGYCIIAIENTSQVKWVKRISDQKSSDSVLLMDFPHTKEKGEKIEIEKIAPIIRVWRTS